MARKDVNLYPVIVDEGMGADITSPVTDCRYMDNVSYQVRWSDGASPVGEIIVEITNQDYPQLLKLGIDPIWTPLDFGATIAIASDDGDHLLNINQYPGAWMRIRYDRASGDGVLNVNMVAKQVGG